LGKGGRRLTASERLDDVGDEDAAGLEEPLDHGDQAVGEAADVFDVVA